MTAEEIVLIAGLLLAAFYVILGLRRPRAALITVPIVCAGFVCAAVLTDAPAAAAEAMALVPVIFLAALITVLLSGRK